MGTPSGVPPELPKPEHKQDAKDGHKGGHKSDPKDDHKHKGKHHPKDALDDQGSVSTEVSGSAKMVRPQPDQSLRKAAETRFQLQWGFMAVSLFGAIVAAYKFQGGSYTDYEELV